jgi:zinc transport system substrate-binding protein
MRTKIIQRAALLAALLAIVAGLTALSHARRGTVAASDSRLQVTASFYPMAEFARQVGGSRATITTLVKPGVEPHDYEPTPQDVAAIYRSKLFIYNGAGLESWAGKLLPDLRAHHITAVRASQDVALKAKDASDTENNSPTDPHIWMDPRLAVQEVSTIQQAFAAADPAHRSTYQANADAYVKQLETLDAAFKSGLAQCTQHSIVTSHQAFSYLAGEYGLQAVGIAGLNPDSEPSPQKLAAVAAFVKANDVRYIFFENLVSPKLSETIARETGAQTISFNPLEGLSQAEIQQGKNYISVQKDNLQALRTALHCE